MFIHRFLASAVLIVAALFIPSPAAAKNVAVVIGVSPPTIPQVVNHATEVATELREGGYEVHELIDEAATKAAIEAVFTTTLSQELAAGDNVFVFISAPAIGGDAGQPWFLAWDTPPTGTGIETSGIEVAGFVNTIGDNVPDTVSLIVVTDTTHTGAIDGLSLIGPDAAVWECLTNTFALASGLPQTEAGWPGFGAAIVAGLGGEADLDKNGNISSAELEQFMIARVLAETSGAETVSVSSTLSGEKVLLVLPPPATAAVPLVIPTRSTNEKRLHRPLAISLLATSALLAGGSTVAFYAGKPLLEDPVADDEGKYRTLRGLNLGFAAASSVTLAVGGTFLFVEF